ncbi:hypothetical protein [Limnobacter sp.]|uniref:hypothetical protein n=1 Tax=Limnobacter sp. TaxID=2003368 RepID=UPI002589B3E8|nr:hypothetical protein [Limnobacter sp.]
MKNSSGIKILWNVWDRESTVSWVFNNIKILKPYKLPPVSVSVLPLNAMVGVVGSFDEFGSSNFQVFSFTGDLINTYTAPDIGTGCSFGSVREIDLNKVDISFGYYLNGVWQDQSGTLDLESSSIEKIHRNY